MRRCEESREGEAPRSARRLRTQLAALPPARSAGTRPRPCSQTWTSQGRVEYLPLLVSPASAPSFWSEACDYRTACGSSWSPDVAATESPRIGFRGCHDKVPWTFIVIQSWRLEVRDRVWAACSLLRPRSLARRWPCAPRVLMWSPLCVCLCLIFPYKVMLDEGPP